MLKLRNRLLSEQLDAKLVFFQQAKDVPIPSEGWIHAIRTAFQMSLRQLGIRMGITLQGAKIMEAREWAGAITIKTLREVAKALNMKLVYGFVPIEGSVQDMIDDRALALARQIVLRTWASMKLEDQENASERLQKAIKERAEELKRELPKLLWD